MFTITLQTIVRRLPAFTTYSSNPIQYRDVATHNAMIDIDCALENGRESCNVAKLVEYHGMTLDFYRKQLPILVRDGYVELSEPVTLDAESAKILDEVLEAKRHAEYKETEALTGGPQFGPDIDADAVIFMEALQGSENVQSIPREPGHFAPGPSQFVTVSSPDYVPTFETEDDSE